MKVSILYFAQVAEKTGISSEEIEVATGCDSEQLVEMLKEKYPAIKTLTFNIAVGQELTRSAVELTEGAEIALLPPFAGG